MMGLEKVAGVKRTASIESGAKILISVVSGCVVPHEAAVL